jgi:hypothetical protein
MKTLITTLTGSAKELGLLVMFIALGTLLYGSLLYFAGWLIIRSFK